MPSQSSNDVYNDRRRGDRGRRATIQEVSGSKIDDIRRRELASFYGEPEKSLVLRRSASQDNDDEKDRQYYASRRTVRRDRSVDDIRASRESNSRRDDHLQRRSNRRDQSPPSDRERSSRNSRRRRDRRPRSEKPPPPVRQLPLNKDKLAKQDEEDGERLWYSGKPRNEGSFLEKHFDSSYDGLFAAAAGAAIGAMGINRLHLMDHSKTEEENRAIAAKKRWKTIGGAVVGAAAFNAGENWFRIYTEEKLESREHVMTGMEFLAEGIDGFIPPAV